MKTTMHEPKRTRIIIILLVLLILVFFITFTSPTVTKGDYWITQTFITFFSLIAGFLMGWHSCLEKIKNIFFKNLSEGKYSWERLSIFQSKVLIVIKGFKIQSISLDKGSVEGSEPELGKDYTTVVGEDIKPENPPI